MVEDHRGWRDPNRWGGCALLYALVKRHDALVELLEPLTDPDLCDLVWQSLPGWFASLEANRSNHRPTMELFMAAQGNGDLDRVRDAIAACGDVNFMMEPGASNTMLGSTPLSFAAGRGRLDMVELLLADGADPTLRDHRDYTAAHYAELNEHKDLAAFLRRAEANWNAPDSIHPTN